MIRHRDLLDADQIVVSSQSTRDELTEAMTHVRAAQASCDDAGQAGKLGEMLDDLLGLWALAEA